MASTQKFLPGQCLGTEVKTCRKFCIMDPKIPISLVTLVETLTVHRLLLVKSVKVGMRIGSLNFKSVKMISLRNVKRSWLRNKLHFISHLHFQHLVSPALLLCLPWVLRVSLIFICSTTLFLTYPPQWLPQPYSAVAQPPNPAISSACPVVS